MRCVCGFSVPWMKAPDNKGCMVCGKTLALDADDVLLHGYGAPGREVRTGQVQMGRLVEKAIADAAMAIIEGPVGSGKSDGYGVPSILAGKRVVIATAKKQLQHQIARKDVPFISQRVQRPVEVALLKGKGNYACRLKLFDIPEEHRVAFKEWLDRSEYGDLTDYPGKRPFFWPDVTAEDCLGQRCKFSNKDCGYWKAKQQSKVAQVIIANHHVVAFDLRFGPFKMLGPYDVLVIDEAHQAEAAFRGAYGQTITPYAVKRIIRKIDDAGLNTGLEKQLEDTWVEMFKMLEHVDGEIPKDPFGDVGDRAIDLLTGITQTVKEEMKEAGAPNGMDEDDEGGSDNVDWERIGQLEMLRKALDRPMSALKEAKSPGDNTVVYVTTSEKKSKTVTVAPISVGPMVGPKLAQVPAVVVTSATIAVNNNFEDIKRRLGLDWKDTTVTQPMQPAAVGPTSMTQAAAQIAAEEKKPREVHELILQSPFDYNRQAVLYTPKHIPLPVGPVNRQYDAEDKIKARDRYLSALVNECARLITAAKGNAFILFTSTQDMKDVHELLLQEDLGLNLIMQGDDAEAALKEFMKTPSSVILGLKSFWEGVDVVGDKLRLVIITKLPFPMVSDPVLKARERQMIAAAVAKGASSQTAQTAVFNAIQIPMMITDLRQGAGRLIRSKTDRGVLAILDCRVWTGSSKRAPTAQTTGYTGYGSLVVNAIGFSQRTSDFALVEKVFKSWFKD